MKAEMIAIGDEILIGQVVDTNSAWIARQLTLAGIETDRIQAVHDRREEILQALEQARGRADLVVMTGGLGPTRDDLTKAVLCEYFGTSLVLHQPTLDHIRDRLGKRGIPVNQLNHDQALVPEACEVLPNSLGTAPGMWFRKGDTLFVSLPGVPFEMEVIMLQEVLPRLRALSRIGTILHKTILTQGVAESVLAERLAGWEVRLPPHIRCAYLPGPMGVRLRLTTSGTSAETLQQDLDRYTEQLVFLLGDSVYGFDEDTLAMAVGRLLLEKQMMLSVAESCTGGNISHLVTLTPGSSCWYAGGITAYSNQAKTDLLGVPEATLTAFGAVSRETAEAMALGVRSRLHTEWAVATTGIAGPGGGSPEKPVGTVWISVASPTKLIAEKFVYGENRERNIIRSSQTTLQMLRKMLVIE